MFEFSQYFDKHEDKDRESVEYNVGYIYNRGVTILEYRLILSHVDHMLTILPLFPFYPYCLLAYPLKNIFKLNSFIICYCDRYITNI